MDRCEEDWYASDKNFVELRVIAGRSRTRKGRLSTAMLCSGLEKNGMVRAWHGRGIASVNHARPHCVNEMGKTHSKPLAARHGHGMLCVNRPLIFSIGLELLFNFTIRHLYSERSNDVPVGIVTSCEMDR